MLVVTSEPQFGLGVQQGLLHLLWLRDVHLQQGEAGGAGPLQLPGSVSIQVQHCGEHLEAQEVQVFGCCVPESGVTACRDTGSSDVTPAAQLHTRDDYMTAAETKCNKQMMVWRLRPAEDHDDFICSNELWCSRSAST